MKADLCSDLFNAIDTVVRNINERLDNKQVIVDFENINRVPFSRDSNNRAGYTCKFETHNHHDYTEICICIEGNLTLQFGEKLVDIEEGDFSIIYPEVSHTELIRQGSNYTAIWISIDNIQTVLHLSGINEDNEFVVSDWYAITSDYEYLQILRNIKAESLNQLLHHSDLIKSHLIHLLIIIIRKIQQLNSNSTEKISWKHSIVNEIYGYIEENYSRHVKLEDISHKLCLSMAYINSIFKSVSGKSIMQYYNDFRIEKAQKLLASQEYSIEDIADLLGYYDQYHFSKTFKSKTGYTPSNYKKNISDSV